MSASIETLQLLALLVESAPEHAVKYASKFACILETQNLEISSPDLIDRLTATAECGRAFFANFTPEHHAVTIAWLRRALTEFRGERNLLEQAMRAVHAFLGNPSLRHEKASGLQSGAVALAAVELELFLDDEVCEDGRLAASCAVLAEAARSPGESEGIIKRLWILLLRGFSAENIWSAKFAPAAADFLAAAADEEFSGEISRCFSCAVTDHLEIANRLLPSLRVVDPVEWTSEPGIVEYLYKFPSQFSDWLLVSALSHPSVSLSACVPNLTASGNNWQPAPVLPAVMRLAPELDDFSRPAEFGDCGKWVAVCSGGGMVETAVALTWRSRSKCAPGLLGKFKTKLKTSESAVKLLYMSLPSFPELESFFCESIKSRNFQVVECPPFSTWLEETISLNS